MDLIEKMIGNRYEILSEAGKGGMATVYKAKDHILNRLVAVKVLKEEFTTDQDFIKRFNAEAQSAARLTHPNIVSIFDVGYEEQYNTHYIVMELVKGKTLKEIIKKEGKLSWKWAVNITMQIASALETAHREGIVHRDIKPHNIIITEDGVAKVTDFGIAKAVSNSTMTAFGTTIGSVHYFSPEQAKGSIIGIKSDLYSLGVVMYEMLTGKVPFDADTPVSIALKHMQEEPSEAIELNEDIPTAVNSIVLKAMQKDLINRYQDAEEMISDLSKALKDPDGNFVVIENREGGYTRVIKTPDENKKAKRLSEKPKNVKTSVMIIGIGVVILIITLIIRLVVNGGFSSKITVPDLKGKTSEEVRTELSKLKLDYSIAELISSEVEEGKVISQTPPALEKVNKGTKVQVFISKGPETLEMPDFVGKTIEEVRKTAEDMDLILKETFENSEKKENTIISQDVEKGKTVVKGTNVNIKVSSGVPKTKVPTVIGMDEGTAKATLTNADLKTKVIYANDSSKENLKVISQSIEQNKEVTVNTTVEITINKIEKVEKEITIKFKVPSLAANATITGNSVNTTQTTEAVAVQIIVNDKLIADFSKNKGETVEQKIKGTGEQNVQIKINGTTRLTRKFNIDEVLDTVIIE